MSDQTITPHDVVQQGIDFLASVPDGALGLFIFIAQPDGQNIMFHERFLAADKLAIMGLIANQLALQKLGMSIKHLEEAPATNREPKAS